MFFKNYRLTNTVARCAAMAATMALTACHNDVKTAEEASDLKSSKDSVSVPAEAPQQSSLAVDVVQPTEKSTMHVTGRLVWDEEKTVRVFSSVAGRVSRVSVVPGQRVAAGETLAWMESPDFGQAQADASKAVADLKLSERTLSRLQDLLQHGAAAQKDVEAAEDDLENRKAERARAFARLKLYGVDAGGVDGLFPLKAPLAGIVVEKNINPGQEVRPDMMLANDAKLVQPLFVISDPNQLSVILDVTELEIGTLKPEQNLKLQVRAYPERVFEGKLEHIGASIDPLTRTVKARGSVLNTDGLLKAEMFAAIDVETSAGGKAPAAKPHAQASAPAQKSPEGAPLEVTSKAVFLKGDEHFVFVETKPGKYERKSVAVGPEHDGRASIIAGLSAGDRVVTEGALLLQSMTEGSKE